MVCTQKFLTKALTHVDLLGIALQSQMLLDQFLVRVHAWVAGSTPGQGEYKRQLIDVSHIDVFLPFFFPLFPSL